MRRRLREDLSDDELAQAGSFRWNDVTRMAWQRPQQIADALDAEGIVFQTPAPWNTDITESTSQTTVGLRARTYSTGPASFDPTEENLDRLRHFLGEIDRHGRRMIFEPRGEAWDDDTVRQLVQDLDLIHAVDPFLREPVGRGRRYFRLHGRPAYNYSYQYTDEDLTELEGMLTEAWTNRVLFNNCTMADDGRRFLKRIR